MKIKNIFAPAMGVMLLLSSCTAGQYWDEPAFTANPSPSFTKTSESLKISPDEQLDKVTVTVGRYNADAAQTVELRSYVSDPELISVPQTVTFAAGQTSATFDITLSTELEPGVSYTAEVVLPEYVCTTKTEAEKFEAEVGKVTTKADVLYMPNSQYKFTLSVTRVLNWNKIGWVMYTDDFMPGLFNIDPESYYVEIEKADGLDRYRLVNAYGENYPYNEPGDWNPRQTGYIEIIADNHDRVYIPNWQTQPTNWGYGNFMMGSRASYYMDNGNSADAIANAGWFGTLKDGKITFPANGLLITMADNFAEGGFYVANPNGAFCVDLNTLTTDNPY